MVRVGSRHFAGVVTPMGVHLVEYRRGVRRLQVLQYVQTDLPAGGVADMVSHLADLVERHGGQGSRLALAIGGFGSFSHILSLPAAPAEVLHPVVMRELRHVYPDLRDATVAFRRTHLEQGEGKGAGRHEREAQLLVGVMPRDIISLLHEMMSARGIALEHITTLPRALQRVHSAFVGGTDPVAVILDVPLAPVVGFFNKEGLQFFSVPPVPRGAVETDVLPVVEQVERGALFLRQQSRGQMLNRIVIAGAAGADLYAGPLRERAIAEEVSTLEPSDVPPGSLAAFGVAMDARSESGLNLLPAGMRPPAEADPWVLQLAVATAGMLILAVAWWGLSSVRATAQLEARVERLAGQLGTRTAPLAAIRPVVEERQQHLARISLLEPLEASRMRLQDILWSTDQAPDPIALDSLSLWKEEGEWRGTVAGAAVARDGAIATEAINDWYHVLTDRFSPSAIRLERLAHARTDTVPGATAARGRAEIDFALTVALPVASE